VSYTLKFCASFCLFQLISVKKKEEKKEEWMEEESKRNLRLEKTPKQGQKI